MRGWRMKDEGVAGQDKQEKEEKEWSGD